MSKAAAAPAAEHPFRALWRTGDLEAWGDALAPDVELHSPVITSPFRGREVALELYAVLLENLGDFEITDELESGGTHAFFWRANARGRRIEGADLLLHDENGRVSEVRVLIRPLVAIAAFASAIGPPLAAKRGRLHAVLIAALTLPLRAMLALADLVAPRLLQRR